MQITCSANKKTATLEPSLLQQWEYGYQFVGNPNNPRFFKLLELIDSKMSTPVSQNIETLKEHLLAKVVPTNAHQTKPFHPMQALSQALDFLQTQHALPEALNHPIHVHFHADGLLLRIAYLGVLGLQRAQAAFAKTPLVAQSFEAPDSYALNAKVAHAIKQSNTIHLGEHFLNPNVHSQHISSFIAKQLGVSANTAFILFHEMAHILEAQASSQVLSFFDPTIHSVRFLAQRLSTDPNVYQALDAHLKDMHSQAQDPSPFQPQQTPSQNSPRLPTQTDTFFMGQLFTLSQEMYADVYGALLLAQYEKMHNPRNARSLSHIAQALGWARDQEHAQSCTEVYKKAQKLDNNAPDHYLDLISHCTSPALKALQEHSATINLSLEHPQMHQIAMHCMQEGMARMILTLHTASPHAQEQINLLTHCATMMQNPSEGMPSEGIAQPISERVLLQPPQDGAAKGTTFTTFDTYMRHTFDAAFHHPPKDHQYPTYHGLFVADPNATHTHTLLQHLSTLTSDAWRTDFSNNLQILKEHKEHCKHLARERLIFDAALFPDAFLEQIQQELEQSALKEKLAARRTLAEDPASHTLKSVNFGL